MQRHIAVAVFLALTAALGFFYLPGHTYLQSDTQVYLPMLERLHDPAAMPRDPVATRPHVAFTLYDEVALTARRITGADFQGILVTQQVLFRVAGLFGIYLVALSLGLPWMAAVLMAAVFGLGATIGGPAVLSIEYEPVPRGFAIMLVFLAIGLAARGRDIAAGAAGALAFLYHAPTTAPFWAVYFALTLWPDETRTMRRRLIGLMPLFAAVLGLLVLSRLQPGISQPQELFSTIAPDQERVLRFRAAYNWISQWFALWVWQYVFFVAALLAFLFYLRREAAGELRWFVIGLPVIGLASAPLSYLLLEGAKLSVMPQYQPARALLFIPVVVGLLGVAAAWKAVGQRRWLVAALSLAVAYAIPLSPRLSDLFTAPTVAKWVSLTAAVLLTTLAFTAVNGARRWAVPVVAVSVIVPFVAFGAWAGVLNYPPLHNADLDALAHWAADGTPREAVFLFADSGRDLAPGVFRARACRALYVDWKSGGQVNYYRSYTREWWERWSTLLAPPFKAPLTGEYKRRGVDYLVLKAAHAIAGATPVYANARYVVYRVAELPGQ